MTAPATAGHRGARVAFLLAGGPLTAFLILITAFGITGTLARETETIPISFTEPVSRIRIDVALGSVTLRGTDRTSITGERRDTRGIQSPSVSEHVENGELVISASCNPIGSTWCEVDYLLDVPRSIDVQVRAALADVRVSDVDGGIDAQSATGSVTIERAGGALRLSSGIGSISGSDLRSPTTEVRSGVGSIDLSFTAPPTLVVGESGAGSIDVEVPRDATTYRVETGADGNTPPRISVPTDPTSEHVLRLDSGAGAVAVHQPEA